MSIEVVMPKMGESIQEGTILRWVKQVGETVERDDVLLEISTDKVDEFFAACEAFVAWQQRGQDDAKAVLPLGDATAAENSLSMRVNRRH